MNYPPPLVFEPEFIHNADTLFEEIRTRTTWDDRLQARLTASFGVPYNYSRMSYPEVPLPMALAHVCDAIAVRLGFRPNNFLANYYPTGTSSMGFHSDSIAELEPGTGVAIVSLGAERTLRFRRIEDKTITHDYPLPPGSLLYMPPDVQETWQHGVPKQPEVGERISLTFRRLTESEFALR